MRFMPKNVNYLCSNEKRVQNPLKKHEKSEYGRARPSVQNNLSPPPDKLLGRPVPTFACNAVSVRMTLTPQFCASVRGMTSNAPATARYGHCSAGEGARAESSFGMRPKEMSQRWHPTTSRIILYIAHSTALFAHAFRCFICSPVQCSGVGMPQGPCPSPARSH